MIKKTLAMLISVFLLGMTLSACSCDCKGKENADATPPVTEEEAPSDGEENGDVGEENGGEEGDAGGNETPTPDGGDEQPPQEGRYVVTYLFVDETGSVYAWNAPTYLETMRVEGATYPIKAEGEVQILPLKEGRIQVGINEVLFLGWYYDAACTQVLPADGVINVTDDITIYAKVDVTWSTGEY